MLPRNLKIAVLCPEDFAEGYKTPTLETPSPSQQLSMSSLVNNKGFIPINYLFSFFPINHVRINKLIVFKDN